MTIIVVTYEMSFAREVADEVIFMDQGDELLNVESLLNCLRILKKNGQGNKGQKEKAF
jgi:ABC-type polar amino acid transport system ATPase subunit